MAKDHRIITRDTRDNINWLISEVGYEEENNGWRHINARAALYALLGLMEEMNEARARLEARVEELEHAQYLTR